MIYLDYNASTPLLDEVKAEMKNIIDVEHGNPSSTHVYGQRSRKAIDLARKNIARLINADVSEVVFTSGGTESNNLAIKGVVKANKSNGNHIITSVIEHPAVINVCQQLEKEGFCVSYIGVDKTGRIDLEELQKEITEKTTLITVMHSNNEVGTIQPIEEISRIARAKNIKFHTDAAQSIGKVKVDVKQLDVDLLSIAGHKLYAPKGVGILYIKKGTVLQKLMEGADQEFDIRPGTENVLEIAGIGMACEYIHENFKEKTLHLEKMKMILIEGLHELKCDMLINGNREYCLPNTLSISFKNVDVHALLSKIPELLVSTGAACHSGVKRMSGVLSAMKIPQEYGINTIRFSTGYFTTEEEINEAVKMIKEKVE